MSDYPVRISIEFKGGDTGNPEHMGEALKRLADQIAASMSVEACRPLTAGELLEKLAFIAVSGWTGNAPDEIAWRNDHKADALLRMGEALDASGLKLVRR